MRKAFIILMLAVIVITTVVGFVSADEHADKDPMTDSGNHDSLPEDVKNLFTPSPESGTASPTPKLPEPTESWALRLVSADAPLPEGFEINTAVTTDGYLFDERAAAALDEMLADGRAQGLQLALNSAYRTYDYQNNLFENKVQRVMAEQSCDRTQAEAIAAEAVSRPGTSEHNLGLAADIVSTDYGTMDEGYEDTPEAQWLREHCAEYGFILRYPPDKQDITKIIYEPWHFRYVGIESAEYIMKNDLCLEEFLALYQ